GRGRVIEQRQADGVADQLVAGVRVARPPRREKDAVEQHQPDAGHEHSRHATRPAGHFLMTRFAGGALTVKSRLLCFALPVIVTADWPGAALAATLSCTFTSFMFAGMFLRAGVTFGGRPVTERAMSPVKPASRVAVTVTLAGLPGVAFSSSNLTARVNGAFSV